MEQFINLLCFAAFRSQGMRIFPETVGGFIAAGVLLRLNMGQKWKKGYISIVIDLHELENKFL
ncbi:hypothetical protein QE422_001476 [Chryseobacterium sp. SORGH_AS 447]|uniref:hypothetical protein n=1 Tax=Chryseobacterium sp. SORGH_AS_0447 TaxID=3041769 RepID=UPI00278460BA|nr:hypothetical protein [Chryseobacterium sp. SORGH_AS_0447]MDQ1161108.1 hypothetical protein [Chryseobacterium sp. SORGH_AS_0447]